MAKKIGIAEAFIAAAELRSGGIITEQEINALKKRWGHRGPAEKVGTRDDEIERFTQHAPYLISAEQTAKGLDWWRKNVQKADGGWRNNKFVNAMDNNKLYMVLCLKHFTLESWWEEYNGYGASSYSPVYRAYSTTGESFAYVGRSWQRGGVEFV